MASLRFAGKQSYGEITPRCSARQWAGKRQLWPRLEQHSVWLGQDSIFGGQSAHIEIFGVGPLTPLCSKECVGGVGEGGAGSDAGACFLAPSVYGFTPGCDEPVGVWSGVTGSASETVASVLRPISGRRPCHEKRKTQVRAPAFETHK